MASENKESNANKQAGACAPACSASGRTPAAAVLAAFAASLGGALRIIFEVAATYMAAFFPCFGSALRVFRKVSASSSMFSHFISPVCFD